MKQESNTLTLEEKRNLPIFFITARPRSGTTLLRTMFDRHSNVIIPVESPFMLRFYWKYHTVKEWNREKILEFYNDITNKDEPYYLNITKWTVDFEQLKSDLLAMAGNTNYAELCRVVNASYISLFPKDKIKLVGDKNPVYSSRTKYLMKLFPEARFIHMTRDYRDYMQSMLRAGFVKGIAPIIAYRWKKSLKINLKLQKKYPERFFFVRYEDLVEKPEKTFRQMCEFLGIPYEEQIFDFHKYRERFVELYSEEEMNLYHSKLFKPISSKNVGDWKKNLTEEQLLIAEAVTGKTAEKAGYSRSRKNIPLLVKMKLWPVYLYLWATNMVGNLMRQFPYKPEMQKVIERGPVLGKKYWEAVKKKEQ
ncbi:MAG TPA: sulfotransferase [Bacteroidales bacterium]|nr:sulfotransferase [Bacteroidales bacterium]